MSSLVRLKKKLGRLDLLRDAFYIKSLDAVYFNNPKVGSTVLKRFLLNVDYGLDVDWPEVHSAFASLYDPLSINMDAKTSSRLCSGDLECFGLIRDPQTRLESFLREKRIESERNNDEYEKFLVNEKIDFRKDTEDEIKKRISKQCQIFREPHVRPQYFNLGAFAFSTYLIPLHRVSLISELYNIGMHFDFFSRAPHSNPRSAVTAQGKRKIELFGEQDHFVQKATKKNAITKVKPAVLGKKKVLIYAAVGTSRMRRVLGKSRDGRKLKAQSGE